jgi:hypothetical protein
MTRRLLTRLLILVAVLGVLGYLFVRSLHDTRTAPYTMAPQHVEGWTLALYESSRGSEPYLVLQPPRQLMTSLSRQIFTRAMESQSVPATPGIPLVLRAEFERAFADQLTPAALVEAARLAGIEQETIRPRCLGMRRESRPGQTRQLQFVLFDSPDVERTRRELAALVSDGDAAVAFDPAALSPVLFVVASDADFGHWLPLRADADADCVAPVVVEGD